MPKCVIKVGPESLVLLLVLLLYQVTIVCHSTKKARTSDLLTRALGIRDQAKSKLDPHDPAFLSCVALHYFAFPPGHEAADQTSHGE
jgi:hypothetical protein